MTDNPNLDACGCCERDDPPAAVENRPGLGALAYRVGTFGAFKRRMLRGLSGTLPELATRDDDDPSIALLDAWAVTLDVLSFYQERIANEGYLRTATERRSVLELASSIGYRLRPGLAAETYLAFLVDEAPGAPDQVRLDVGTRSQSQPEQDELPQVYETLEPLVARREWNAVRPRLSRMRIPVFGERSVTLRGTSTMLKPGDGILMVGRERELDPTSERWDFRIVESVEEDSKLGITRVGWRAGLGIHVGTATVQPAAQDFKVFALRQKAALFGYNAPDWKLLPAETKSAAGGSSTADEWPNFNIAYASPIPSDLNRIYLDGLYPTLLAGSWVVLSRPGYQEVYTATEVAEDARANFGVSGKSTRLTLEGENLAAIFGTWLRQTVVYGGSQRLPLAETPLDEPVAGDRIVLDRLLEMSPEGRMMAIEGQEHGTGQSVAEVREVVRVETEDGLTRMVLDAPLENAYIRDTATINLNVAPASHGEARAEVLGSGDASRPFQNFALKSDPLTYVSDAGPTGSRSTLEVRVDGVLWEETDTLYGKGPGDRVYTVRHREDGTAEVTFGDGQAGARPPTGTENIVARYRKGSGTEGRVQAGQIKLLLTRPLGLKDVWNPVAPVGGAAPERLEDARANAPTTVLTFGRIVSLRDYEDFARAFSGIAKAQARRLWSGERRLVHLTVAAEGGGDVSSSLMKNLQGAVDASRHRLSEIRIDTYERRMFRLEAQILHDPSRESERVLEAVEAELYGRYAFSQRAFAQPVTESEVLAAIQGVPGVAAATIVRLHFADESPTRRAFLAARSARFEGGDILPAELLTLASGGVVLEEMTP
jgi:hypothetical protein